MRTDLVLFTFLLTLSSCRYPPYLTRSDAIGTNPYGAYIEVNTNDHHHIHGELISADANRLIILNKSNECESVSKEDIRKYYVRYAKPVNYGWSIPLFALASILQGELGVITFPINMITTITVTSSSHSSFTYASKELAYDQLKMFARFPQGIPDDIRKSDIKNDFMHFK